MIKNKESKVAKATSKAKKGMKYVCDSCGIILSVEEACDCDLCDIICCGQDMKVLTSFPKEKGSLSNQNQSFA